MSKQKNCVPKPIHRRKKKHRIFTHSSDPHLIREADFYTKPSNNDMEDETQLVSYVIGLQAPVQFAQIPDTCTPWHNEQKTGELTEDYEQRIQKYWDKRKRKLRLLRRITRIVKRDKLGTPKQWEIARLVVRNILTNRGDYNNCLAKELNIPPSTLYQQLYGRRRKTKFINGLIHRLVKYIEINEPTLLKLL